jgi:hypothetical protein
MGAMGERALPAMVRRRDVSAFYSRLTAAPTAFLRDFVLPLLTRKEALDDHLRKFMERTVGVEIDVARALYLEAESQQAAGGNPDEIVEQGRIAGLRDPETLKLLDVGNRFGEQRPQVLFHQPVESLARVARFLHDDLVQCGIVVRIAYVGANERFGPLPGLGRRNISHDLGEGIREVTENPVRRGPPEKLLVLEVISDEGVVNPGAVGDFARGGAFEAVFRERFRCRVQQLMLSHD